MISNNHPSVTKAFSQESNAYGLGLLDTFDLEIFPLPTVKLKCS